MKNFKTIFFTLLLVLTINISFCQVIKFRTTSTASSSFVDKIQKWGNWEEESNSKDILISMDITNERVKIYSKTEQVFDIIEYYAKTTDDDNDEVISFQCVDKDGTKGKFRIVTIKSQENIKQMYVGYSNVTFLYNMYNLD